MRAAFGQADGVAPDGAAEEPIPKTTVRPTHPEFAREAQIQGRVVLEVLVGVDGKVAAMNDLKGVTGLNQAAMQAVRQWTFIPAHNAAGEPIEAWTTIPVDFHF